MRPSTSPLAWLGRSGCCLALVAAAARLHADESAPALSVTLACAEAAVVGKRAPIAVTIRNSGDQPVTLVEPGDGSEVGWRTPVIAWETMRDDDPGELPAEPIAREPGLRCGNINALKAAEVFVVPAGGSRVLDEWVCAPDFEAPGRYRVVLFYSNDPKLVWKGGPLGPHDVAAMERVRASTSCRLRSNEIVVTVTAPP